jgi:hypothetical protein
MNNSLEMIPVSNDLLQQLSSLAFIKQLHQQTKEML